MEYRFFHTLCLMKRRENTKVVVRWMDLITIYARKIKMPERAIKTARVRLISRGHTVQQSDFHKKDVT